jgi:hypothetical protein
VYWRRRAIVVAGLAVAAVLGWLAVHGLAAPSQSERRTSPTGLAAAPGTRTASATAPVVRSSPGFVPESAEPTATASRVVPPASVRPCADDDLTLTATAAPSPGVFGGTFTFTVTIGNVSGVWCSRDLGPGAQELRVLHDGALVFSSDDCGTTRSGDLRAFAAGDAVRYRFEWSSYRATPHDCTPAAEPARAGTYQVLARLGTKTSIPTSFDIVR